MLFSLPFWGEALIAPRGTGRTIRFLVVFINKEAHTQERGTAHVGGWIALGVIVGILLLGLAAYGAARRKVRVFSRQAFGTSSLMEGLRRAQQEAEETPRSLSGGDRIYRKQILRDFPDFNLPLAKSYAERCVTDFLSAVEKGDAAPLAGKYAEKITALARSRIEDARNKGEPAVFDRLQFYNTTVARYTQEGYDRVIRFQTAFSYYNRKGAKVQAKYELHYAFTLRGEGAPLSGLRCDYCGAPLSSVGEKVCEYCGNALVAVLDQTWRFINLLEL